MGRIIMHVREQRVVIDTSISEQEAEELFESGDIAYEYDPIISDAVLEIDYELFYEEN